MKGIIVIETDICTDKITETEWAVNDDGEGLFSRRRDGTWQQHVGTCDFRAKSPAHLSRQLKNPSTDRKMVRGSARGW